MSREERAESETKKYQALKDGGKYYGHLNHAAGLMPLLQQFDMPNGAADFGCGNGDLIKFLSYRCFPEAKFYGIDLVEYDGFPHSDTCELIKGYMTDTGLPDNCVNFSFAFDSLEHIPPKDVPDVIWEMYRVATCGIITRIPDNERGNKHLSVHPYQWWHEEFTRVLNHINLDIMRIQCNIPGNRHGILRKDQYGPYDVFLFRDPAFDEYLVDRDKTRWY